MSSLTVDRAVPGAASAPGMTVSGLSFRYPGARASVLRDVGFTVTSGQVLGVLGANGSGKSTLLNALLDVRSGQRAGTVTFTDADRGQAALASQSISLYQQLTVLENLRHAARTQLPRRLVRAAVDDAIAEYGLDAVARRPVHQLSGGWQRITHIATSFVHRPMIRLLDEPTAALDFEARGRLVALVGNWRRAGTLILVTSHYPEDIEEIGTHALVIHNGTVARHETLADLLASHRRELVIDVATDAGPEQLRRPAPATVADAHALIEGLLGDGATQGTLRGIRLTDNTLRELLAADPQLKGLLDDDD